MLVQEHVDVAGASISLLLARIFGDGKRQFKLADFLPHWDGAIPQQSVEEMLDILSHLNQGRAKDVKT